MFVLVKTCVIKSSSSQMSALIQVLALHVQMACTTAEEKKWYWDESLGCWWASSDALIRSWNSAVLARHLAFLSSMSVMEC